MRRAPCGCRAEVDPASGVLRSAGKCRVHAAARRDPATLDRAYYAGLGILDEPQPHLPELIEALGAFPHAAGNHVAVELGCGCSPYAGAIRDAGWHYVGLDASPFAASWTADRWGVDAMVGPIESQVALGPCRLILAAHVLEHLEDAPGTIARLAAALHRGGELWLIVPDDSDLANADHLWYFTEATLRGCVERAGLSVLRFAVFRRVRHENFIYLRAVRP